MDIQKINDFLRKHGTHTISVEKIASGVRVGRAPQYKKRPNSVLGVHFSHIIALYCCGECCK